MMDYSFARQLITAPDGETAQRVYEVLTAAGFEVFVEGDAEGTFPNMHAGDSAPGGRLYVAAADRAAALSLVQPILPAAVITPESECVPDSILTEEEKVYAAARRKRKWLYIECGLVVLIALAILWLR